MERVELGELMLRRGGSVDPSKFRDETFELYSIPAYDRGEPEILPGSEIGSSKKLLRENDVIISRIIPHIRRVWVVNPQNGHRQIGSGEWIVFRSKRIFPQFVRYFLLSDLFNGQFMKTVKGVGGSLLRADPRQVEKFLIPLPPLSEQRRIASQLDQADRLRQLYQAQLSAYDELARSLFLEMFGDPVKNEKGWEKRKLGEVTNVITKGESPKWQGYSYVEEGIRFITSENVLLGSLNIEKKKFIPHAFHEKLNRSQLCQNDLLVNLVGASIGRGAKVDSSILPANINQAVAKIELDESLCDSTFMLNQLICPSIQESLIGNKVEGARANISLKNVREQIFIFPPLPLQKQFAVMIENIERQKGQVQAAAREAEGLFQGLLQGVFGGA